MGEKEDETYFGSTGLNAEFEMKIGALTVDVASLKRRFTGNAGGKTRLPFTSTFLMRKQAILNSCSFSRPFLFVSAKSQISKMKRLINCFAFFLKRTLFKLPGLKLTLKDST